MLSSHWLSQFQEHESQSPNETGYTRSIFSSHPFSGQRMPFFIFVCKHLPLVPEIITSIFAHLLAFLGPTQFRFQNDGQGYIVGVLGANPEKEKWTWKRLRIYESTFEICDAVDGSFRTDKRITLNLLGTTFFGVMAEEQEKGKWLLKCLNNSITTHPFGIKFQSSEWTFLFLSWKNKNGFVKKHKTKEKYSTKRYHFMVPTEDTELWVRAFDPYCNPKVTF